MTEAGKTQNRRKKVYGVGINDADYIVATNESYEKDGVIKQRRLWVCPFYERWSQILKRCYCKSHQRRFGCYNGATICKDWKYFSKFKAWMESQDWKNKHLDKDILVDGNMIYSPETCAFVSQKVNTFILGSKDKLNGLPKGVSRHSQNPNRYNINIAFNGKKILAPSFLCPYQAHLWYAKKKLELCLILIDIEKPDSRVGEKLIQRCKEQLTEAEKLLSKNS